MLRTLGVTGGIGSGKSAVCAVLRALGARLFEADQVAKSLLEYAPQVREAVTAAFGPQAYGPQLDRRWLAGRVFRDARALARLNAIVHPYVRDAFAKEREAAVRARERLLVLEAALIFESGFDAILDRVVVVDAPVEVRIARAMARDGVTAREVRLRMQHQWAPEALMCRAHRVIDNSASLARLSQEAERLYCWATQG